MHYGCEYGQRSSCADTLLTAFRLGEDARAARARAPRDRVRGATSPSTMHSSTAPAEGLRVALIFTGHLRATCDRGGSARKGLQTLLLHASNCREAFDHCDIFLHSKRRASKA